MLLVSTTEITESCKFRRSAEVERQIKKTMAASRCFFKFVLKCHRDIASLGHLLTANSSMTFQYKIVGERRLETAIAMTLLLLFVFQNPPTACIIIIIMLVPPNLNAFEKTTF